MKKIKKVLIFVVLIIFAVLFFGWLNGYIDLNYFKNQKCRYTPLMKAAKNGWIEKVRELLKKGENINEVVSCSYNMKQCPFEDDSKTALIFAIENENIDIVKLLLDNGADFNSIPQEGYSALEASVEKGNIEVVKLLLDFGAQIDKKLEDCGTQCGCYHESVLIVALLNGNLEIAKLFINKGADVNRKSYLSQSPLMIAVEKGYTEIVKLLLEKGADVSVNDTHWSIAFKKALENNQTGIVELLKRAGALEKRK